MNKIAMNGRMRPNRGRAFQQELTAYDALIREPWLANMIDGIRGGNEELKKQLPFRATHYHHFNNDHRTQRDADKEAFLFQTTVDVDEKEIVEEALQKALAMDKDDASPWKGMLLHAEYSARKKLHLDIRMPIGKTISETQTEYCEALGIPFDEGCVTPERFIYITDKRQEIYRSEEWYAILPDEELAARRKAFTDRGLTIDGRGNAATARKAHIPQKTEEKPVTVSREEAAPASLMTFDLCVKAAGLDAEQMDVFGVNNWHNNLKAVLSVGLPKMLSKEQTMAVIRQRLPNYSQEKDCEELVRYFYDNYAADKGFMTKEMRMINAKAQMCLAKEVESNEASVRSAIIPEEPAMPKERPRVVDFALRKLPAYQHNAVALCLFAPLNSNFHNVRFRYVTNQFVEPSAPVILLGDAGVGKGGFDNVVAAFTALIKETDEVNRQRDEEYKEQVNSLPDSRKKPVRPKDICYQILNSDCTSAALQQRMVDCERAGGKFIFSHFPEANMLKGIAKDLNTLVQLSYDCQIWGAERVGTKSVSGNAPLRWNFSVSTNMVGFRRTFNMNQVLYDGTLQRIAMGYIKKQQTDATTRGRDLVPVYGDYDNEYMEEAKVIARKASGIHGDIEPPEELRECILSIIDKKYEVYMDSQDEFFNEYSNRAALNAFKRGMVLWLLDDRRWSAELEEWVKWSFWYEMWVKCTLLSEEYESFTKNVSFCNKRNRGPKNMLFLLNEKFTLDELMTVRRREGKAADDNSARNQLRVWLSRGMIKKDSENDTFIKCL